MASIIKVDQIQSDTGTVNVASKIEFPVGSAAAPSIFPTGDTNTGIFFPAADTIAFAEGGAEAMRIDSSGNVGIGTTSPGNLLHVSGSGTDLIRFQGSSRSAYLYQDAGGIGWATGTNLSGEAIYFNSATNLLRFYTNSTERARIASDGSLILNSTNNSTSGTDGKWYYFPGGEMYVARNGGIVSYFNRNTDDGTIIDFRQANSSEGSISVSGNTVSYNQFLGSHWAALTDWSKPDIKIGTILDSINELVIWKFAVIEVEEEIPAKEAVLDDEGNEIEPAVEAHIGSVEKKICYNGNAEVGTTVSVEYEGQTYQGVVELEREREFTKAVKVKVNDTAASKAVYGVFVGWNNDTNGNGGVWNDMYVGAVGNYVIRMAAGQEPEIGDLIEADGNGCGVVQDDDIVRTKTVGKITSNIVQKNYEDGSFLVTCVLYSG